jgi:hypothetical protein
MAVSILTRPEGHILPTTSLSCGVSIDTGGTYVFRASAHNVNVGDYVYLYTNVEAYNGFWYVTFADSVTFIFRVNRTPAGAASGAMTWFTPVALDGKSFFFKVTEQHGWNCVHLPIRYQLTNTAWPTNSIDTVRTISGVANSNGYCEITASGDIRATGSANKLFYVKVSSATDDSLNGVHQITGYTSDTVFVINVAYSAANDTALTGASIQFYYNNYSNKVKIYAGLESDHVFQEHKPIGLLSEITINPDSDNLATFSLSEILKSQVITDNNLLYGTLPNNINFFTSFYIEYAESYDTSDGTTLSTFTSSYTDDSGNFIGQAVNAKLPFKSRHSGSLSQYILANSASKFLTLFDQPRIFAGCSDYNDCYFDIGFIVPKDFSLTLEQKYYIKNVLQATTNLSILDYDIGVYRQQLTNPDCSYDQVIIRVLGHETFDLDELTNDASAGVAWTLVSDTQTYPNAVVGAGVTTKNLIFDEWERFIDLTTLSYTFNIQTFVTGGTGQNVIVSITNAGGGSVLATNTVAVGNGLTTTTITLTFANTTDLENARRLRLRMQDTALGADKNFTVQIFSPSITDVQVSESKTINIDCNCSNYELRMTWLNYLGGFDYWDFQAQKEYQLDVQNTRTTKNNIISNWPYSYGEFADTIDQQTGRDSKNAIVVRSQILSAQELEAIKHIKSSPLVQIINSRHDRRTVIVDSDSFKVYDEADKQFSISFKITYTDDIPSQTV